MKREELIKLVGEMPEEINAASYNDAKENITSFWGLTNGMWTFAAKSPAEFSLKLPVTVFGKNVKAQT